MIAAVDIGGSRVKVGWKARLDGQFSVATASSSELCRSPAVLKEGVERVLRDRAGIRALADLAILGLSVTGVVSDNVIIRSDRLAALAEPGSVGFDGLDLPKFFAEVGTVHAINAGLAAAFGACVSGAVQYPFMLVALGTGVCIYVVGHDARGPRFHAMDSWVRATVETPGGPRNLHSALGATGFLGESIEAPERRQVYSQRVSSGLIALLSRYDDRFKWQPRNIVLTGGMIAYVSAGVVQRSLGDRSELIVPATDLAQMSLPLQGCLCASLFAQ